MKIILKLGGSVITSKESSIPQIKSQTLHRLGAEIKKAQLAKEFQLIIVHGAGPFGHLLVQQHNINEGVKTKEQVKGFIETHISVSNLNTEVVAILQQEGVMAFPIQPSACIQQTQKKITHFDTTALTQLLALSNEIVPVLYGDMVPDVSLGASVVSGDAIVPYLATQLKADKVLIGTDVTGIFSADPKLDSTAALIPEITPATFNSIVENVGVSTHTDVTEGMKGKLKQLEQLKGTDALIFDLTQPGMLEKALTNQKIQGTEIKWES